ncbi:hypothetical protein VTI28DRAFT_6911 [Corynascus sepedonium]
MTSGPGHAQLAPNKTIRSSLQRRIAATEKAGCDCLFTSSHTGRQPPWQHHIKAELADRITPVFRFGGHPKM